MFILIVLVLLTHLWRTYAEIPPWMLYNEHRLKICPLIDFLPTIEETVDYFTAEEHQDTKYVLFAEYKGPQEFWHRPIYPEDLGQLITDGEDSKTVEGIYFWLSCPMDESVLHGIECQADGTWSNTIESLLNQNPLFCKTEEEKAEFMAQMAEADKPQESGEEEVMPIGGHTLEVEPEELETVTIVPEPENVTIPAPEAEQSMTLVSPEPDTLPEPEVEEPQDSPEEDTEQTKDPAVKPAGELEQSGAVSRQGMSTPVIIGIAGGSFALLSCGGLAWYLRRKLCKRFFEDDESKSQYDQDLELGELRDAVRRNVKVIQEHSGPKEIFSEVVHGGDSGVADELNDIGDVAIDMEDDARSVATYRSFVEQLVARSPAIFRLWEKYDIEHLGSEEGLKKIEHMHTNVKH